MDRTDIRPCELRALLIEATKAVLDGRLTVQQANALSSLSAEIHKSIKLEYVGQVITSDKLVIDADEVINRLGRM